MTIRDLLQGNQRWADRVRQEDPGFFEALTEQQAPNYLWIGCSDSRVPSNQILDVLPGEVFVHRNIANIVNQNDINFLSVLQFGIEVLKIKHVLVCGHYGCGGVRAALDNADHGMVDNWVRPIKDIYLKDKATLDNLASKEQRVNMLCELNVKQQVHNVSCTTVIQRAWAKGQDVSVHGLIYSVADGILHDTGVSVSSRDCCDKVFYLDTD